MCILGARIVAVILIWSGYDDYDFQLFDASDEPVVCDGAAGGGEFEGGRRGCAVL